MNNIREKTVEPYQKPFKKYKGITLKTRLKDKLKEPMLYLSETRPIKKEAYMEKKMSSIFRNPWLLALLLTSLITLMYIALQAFWSPVIIDDLIKQASHSN